MSDITANVVVSMPSQLFTMPRSFKAVANGKIYIGKIDTDPVNPENQIPVYLENEDGSHVQVAQPIVINAGGYPVYNGQIAKFVTVQGHSMAVYDSYGAQQFYYPNVLKYDPDQFRIDFEATLASGDFPKDVLYKYGLPALVPGVTPRTLQSRLDDNVPVSDFGAIGDGALHPLSEFFSTLSDAQAKYPFITSLSQSIDFAAFQAAVNSGARWITSPRKRLYQFVFTDTVRVSTNNTSLDLNGSEIRMVDATGLKPHFLFKAVTDVQLQGNTIQNATLINENVSTVHQIKTDFVAGFTVYKCTGYSPSYGRVWGFVELKRAIACFVLRSITERMKDSSVSISGLAPAEHHSIDCMVYDCRFSDGDYGIKVGNYSEGMFFRRVFTYAQRVTCIGFIPDSKTTALGSIKMQEIDFDSPNLTGSFLFMRYVSNVQVTGSWFSGSLASPMIRTEETDAVMINSCQAYPTDAFILDNGIGTTITSNMIVGGTVSCQFGSLADKTLIQGNSIRGVTSCVDAGNHFKSLSVLGNRFEASGSSITATSNTLHIIKGNSGDNSSGFTTSSFIPSSPYETRVGARPESISFRKGGSITSISVNDVEVYNSIDAASPSSFIGLGLLPPNSKIIVSFTTGNPWLNRIRN
ncbi:phage head-binding domain-containing protein [Citrobacter pasteurii]